MDIEDRHQMVRSLENLQMFNQLTNSYLLSVISYFSVAVIKYQEQEQFKEERVRGLTVPEGLNP